MGLSLQKKKEARTLTGCQEKVFAIVSNWPDSLSKGVSKAKAIKGKERGTEF